MSEPEIDNSMETFMTLFNKMFSETKYNLQALNKRMESMDKCFCNILLLSSDKPFDEENLEENNENSKNENINQDNIPKRKKNNTKNQKNKNNKMTEEDLDEIEKMFRNIDDDPIPSPKIQEDKTDKFLNKKRKSKPKKEEENNNNEIKDSKNLFHDIKELLKNYSLDNDEDSKKEIKKEEKPKGKRGRKKKIIKDEENENDSESNEDVDYLVPEKNDGYSKFKEFKELKKKVGNKIYNKSSDEDDEDELDSDF